MGKGLDRQVRTFGFGAKRLAQELDIALALRQRFFTIVGLADLSAGFLTGGGAKGDKVFHCSPPFMRGWDVDWYSSDGGS